MHWENREHYFELIAGERLQADLILLEPNPNGEGLGLLIDDVISVFHEYCAKVRDKDELSDFEVKKRIERIFE